MPSGADTKILTFDTEHCTYATSALMGKGTYGSVYSVYSVQDPAIKKALKTYFDKEHEDGVPATTIRELNALKALSGHPNVVVVDEVVWCPNGPHTLFFTMELCCGDLNKRFEKLITRLLTPLKGVDFSRVSSKGQLPSEYVREAKLSIWQLLNGIAFCHSNGVAHRDLKPANILWTAEGTIKIADLGLCRFMRGTNISASSDGVMPVTGEVQTMWYRAPEVILGVGTYGPMIDDWSIGCIMGELFNFVHKGPSYGLMPIFKGQCEMDTLISMLDTLGTPSDTRDVDYYKKLPYWSMHFPKYKCRLKDRFFHLDPLGLDLLKKLLCMNPSKRTSARFLLDHPWFTDIQPIIREMDLWIKDPSIASLYAFNQISTRPTVGEENTDNQNTLKSKGGKVNKPCSATSTKSGRRIPTGTERLLAPARSRSPDVERVTRPTKQRQKRTVSKTKKPLPEHAVRQKADPT